LTLTSIGCILKSKASISLAVTGRKTMKTTGIITHTLTATEAVRLITITTGKSFHISASINLPVPSKPGFYFPGYSTAKVSRKTAVRFVTDALASFEERGARIEIKEYEKILFIG
jgi:hypothetical protein